MLTKAEFEKNASGLNPTFEFLFGTEVVLKRARLRNGDIQPELVEELYFGLMPAIVGSFKNLVAATDIDLLINQASVIDIPDLKIKPQPLRFGGFDNSLRAKIFIKDDQLYLSYNFEDSRDEIVVLNKFRTRVLTEKYNQIQKERTKGENNIQ